MKKTKDFNNISDKLYSSVRLKKGEKAVFKLTGIKPDPDNPGKFLIRSGTSIREYDRVFDSEKNEWVDIAHIVAIDREGKHTASPIIFTKESMGVLELSGDFPAEADMAAYLRLSSYNASNEFRDKALIPKFFEVNPVKDAEQDRKLRSARLSAMTAAAALSDEEAREMYAAIGQDSTDEITIIREYLERLAETKPEQFNIHFSDKAKQIKATIKKAIDAKVLGIDTMGSKIIWSSTGETAFSFVKKAGVEPINEFADHILNGKNGDKILAEIKKSLGAEAKK